MSWTSSGWIGSEAYQAVFGVVRLFESPLQLGLVDGKWNDLHRRHHLAAVHVGKWRQRRDRDRLVDPVQLIDLFRVQQEKAGRPREQIDPAGKRSPRIYM